MFFEQLHIINNVMYQKKLHWMVDFLFIYVMKVNAICMTKASPVAQAFTI